MKAKIMEVMTIFERCECLDSLVLNLYRICFISLAYVLFLFLFRWNTFSKGRYHHVQIDRRKAPSLQGAVAANIYSIPQDSWV